MSRNENRPQGRWGADGKLYSCGFAERNGSPPVCGEKCPACGQVCVLVRITLMFLQEQLLSMFALILDAKIAGKRPCEPNREEL